jgi:S-adenosylmethionine:tRNA ribosyltransferase-isomerase
MEDKGLHSLKYYDYALPPELIAQKPVEPRDSSRLLIVDRRLNRITETVFSRIGDFLNAGDVLVLNDTKVINARLFGKRSTGAKIEAFLLNEVERGLWHALVNPAKRARVGERIDFQKGVSAVIKERTPDGGRLIEFTPLDIREFLSEIGEVPLPPYIKSAIDDPQKYQTVYAQKDGAVAAPTAGLHFTPGLLAALAQKGVEVLHLTLHCGLATFRPVKVDDVREHLMSKEWVEISAECAKKITKARQESRRVIAVGTTSLRSLESAAQSGAVMSFQGETDIYIYSGYNFKAVDALITNFHTPCSTNLVLVSAFGGYELVHKAYQYAIERKFRFFSFGDAMLIL